MDILHTIFLAIVQGFTEFLPISSSAHLILLPKLINWQDQGLAFDIALHLGTLVAVIFYYQQDVVKLSNAFFNSLTTRRLNDDSKFIWGILIATIPVGLIGLLAQDFITEHLRSMTIIAYSTIIFALFLALADWHQHRRHNYNPLTLVNMLIIGCAQAIALIPGTSRSGITITAALLLGIERQLAAKFCFLLAIPVIVLSSLLTAVDLLQSPSAVDWLSLLIGFAFSAVVAYLTIGLFIKLINTIGMLPFVIYRLILGVVLLSM